MFWGYLQTGRICLFLLYFKLSAGSAPQELSPSKSLKPALLMKGRLQRPKPNLPRAAKKKDVSSEGERSTEDKAGKDTEDKLGKISSLMVSIIFILVHVLISECATLHKHACF